LEGTAKGFLPDIFLDTFLPPGGETVPYLYDSGTRLLAAKTWDICRLFRVRVEERYIYRVRESFDAMTLKIDGGAPGDLEYGRAEGYASRLTLHWT
jgi:hypothetical protein